MSLPDDERLLDEIELLSAVFALVAAEVTPQTADVDEALGVHGRQLGADPDDEIG